MMWRIALAAWMTAALSLFALSAPHAQFNGCMAGFCSPSVAATSSYSGPGDIAGGGIEFVSCGRAYNAAYATGLNAACDVVDTATGLTTCTFHFLSTGFVNTTECNATACAIACSVTKMYDQTGTVNHVAQATLANMPGLTFNAQNGLPCAAGAAVAGLVLTGPTITQALPATFTAVAKRTSAAAASQIIESAANTQTLQFTNSANTAAANIGGTSVTLTVADNAFHAFLAVGSATAPLFAVDSSANTSTSTQGTTGLNGAIAVINRATGSREMTNGFLCEAGIWPADLNSSYQAMLANMRSAANGWNF
jgi:hypothetical protein